MAKTLQSLSMLPTTKYSAEDVLSLLFQNGSIDIGDVENAMKKNEIERIIKEKHKYKLYQDNDGRWRTYVKDDSKKSGRRAISKSTLEKLNNALYEFYTTKGDSKEHNEISTLEDLFPDWIQMKKLHGATYTYILKLNRHWNRYYLDTDIVSIPIAFLTKKQLDVWAHTSIDQFNLTRKEYTNMTVIIRGLLEDAMELGIIQENPFLRVKINPKKFRKVKKHDDLEQVFTVDEMKQIEEYAWAEVSSITHLSKHRQSLIPLAVLFQFQTGIRVCELAALRYEDILPGGNGIMIQRMYRFASQEIDEYTKGNYGDRMIPLTEEAKRIIETARQLQDNNNLSSDGYIFSVTDCPPCYNVFYNRYLRYCELLKTKSKATHSARKTFVSALLSNGANLNTVRNACGHVDERTTLHNYCYDMSTEEEKAEIFDKALDWKS